MSPHNPFIETPLHTFWDALGYLIEHPTSAKRASWELLALLLDRTWVNWQKTAEDEPAELIFNLLTLRFEMALEALNIQRQKEQGVDLAKDFRAKPYHRYHALAQMEWMIKQEFKSLSPLLQQKILEDTQLALLESYAEKYRKPDLPVFRQVIYLSMSPQDPKTAWDTLQEELHSVQPDTLALQVLTQGVYEQAKIAAFSVLAYFELLEEHLSVIKEQLAALDSPWVLKEKMLVALQKMIHQNPEPFLPLLESNTYLPLHQKLIDILSPTNYPHFIQILQDRLEKNAAWNLSIRLSAYQALAAHNHPIALDDVLLILRRSIRQSEFEQASQAVHILGSYPETRSYLKSILKELTKNPLDKLSNAFFMEQETLVAQISRVLERFS